MSLGVVIKGPEGVVLAADSRITLEARRADGLPFLVTFDNATKLLSFGKPHSWVGAVTYGAAVIGSRTAHSFVPEFELALSTERLPVLDYAKRLSAFFMERWKEVMPPDYKGPNMTFIVGGYDESAAYGKVFLFDVPQHPDPEPRNPGEADFGMTWGGQLEIASRIIHGYDPSLIEILRTMGLEDQQLEKIRQAFTKSLEFRIPYAVLPLQDCVNLAAFLIRTTMIAQDLAVGIRGVGGPIDVARITRVDGLQYVQRKEIHVEV